MSAYDAIIFDLDGTLFRGGSPIPGAAAAVNSIKGSANCRFLSNNGETSGATLAKRLREMGVAVNDWEVISSADLVVQRLSSLSPGSRVLPITSRELAASLEKKGLILVEDANADVVVVGVDRDLTRRRLVAAFHALLDGATLVATNEDPTYPGEDGLHPAAGAYVGLFRGMGFEPNCFCGKPDARAVRIALRTWDFLADARCLFVGDNLQTDIAAAERVQADSALVLTGVSSADDLKTSLVKPAHVFRDLTELHAWFFDSGGPLEREPVASTGQGHGDGTMTGTGRTLLDDTPSRGGRL